MSKDNLFFYFKYTIGTYLDIIFSIPIFIFQQFFKYFKVIIKLNEINSLKLDSIIENSSIFKKRKKLREELETLPGVLNIRSNIVASILMILTGIPIAKFAWNLIYNIVKDSSILIQYISNALITVMAQLLIGYLFFIIIEIYSDKKKYSKNNILSSKKIFKGLVKIINSYLIFDIIYFVMKISGQLFFLYLGKDPGYASFYTDLIAFSLFYIFALFFGLHTGLIQIEKNVHKHL